MWVGERCPSGNTPAWIASYQSSLLLACIHVSGNQKGNQRVPSTFRFRKFPGKPERGCLELHSGNSRVSLSLRAGLGQNLRRNRGTRQNTQPVAQGNFQVYPGILPLWLILGPNQLISTEFPRETREETRGCCRETPHRLVYRSDA